MTNISGYEISQKTGISEMSISNYRRGKSRPIASNAEILYNFFKKEGFIEEKLKNFSKKDNKRSRDNSDCMLCKEKERIIKSLKTTIEVLQKNLNIQEQLTQELKSKNERNAHQEVSTPVPLLFNIWE